MITRGSKYFYGAAAFGLIAAILYGIVTAAASRGGIVAVVSGAGGIVDVIVGPITLGWKGGVGEHVGYSVLMGFAGLMAILGGFHTAFRDGDAEATAQVSNLTAAPPVSVPFGLSAWPILTAFFATMLVVGLAVSSALFVIGLIGFVVSGFEWTVRAWSERATVDPALNRELRNRFMLPVEVPVGTALGAGLVIFSVSRILLAVPKTAAAVLIIVLSVLVFVLALVLAQRPELKRSLLVTVAVVV
ncbi:MAG: hypothetical protein ACKOYM_09840 [Actinomycetes bacterium]